MFPEIKIGGQEVVMVGETVDIHCTATTFDSQIVYLEWLKDGRPVGLENGIENAKDVRVQLITHVPVSSPNTETVRSTLRIANAKQSDDGVYVCRFTERSHMAGVKLTVKSGWSSPSSLKLFRILL